MVRDRRGLFVLGRLLTVWGFVHADEAEPGAQDEQLEVDQR
jgi:hypothetical protein